MNSPYFGMGFMTNSMATANNPGVPLSGIDYYPQFLFAQFTLPRTIFPQLIVMSAGSLFLKIPRNSDFLTIL